MLTASEVRRLALALPEAHEEDHHGIPSFRVRNKIFATVPDDGHVNVMLGAEETAATIAAASGEVAELWWGQKLAGVQVSLARADHGLLAPLLREAWRRRAPNSLAKLLDRDG